MASIKRSIDSEITSNKRIKTEMDVNSESIIMTSEMKRQSFDRMDETLIKRIAYYFELKDKLCLMGLNKPMMRFISESQLDLIICHLIGNKFNCLSQFEAQDIDEDIEDSDPEEDYFFKLNTSALKHILKTFKEIESIDLRNCLLDKQIVALICDNCSKLKTLKFTDIGIKDESIIEMGKRFGQTLTKLFIQSSFCCNKLDFDKLFLNYCQNLIEIHCESIETFTEINDNFLPKLQIISTFIRKIEDFSSLKLIVNKYKDQLKSLALFIHLDDGSDVTKDLECVSNLVHLESLNLDFFDPLNVLEEIDKSIELIAINCRQMNSFRIGLNYCFNDLISLNLFRAFGLFSNITRFSAELLIKESQDMEEDEEEEEKVNERVDNPVLDSVKADISCLKECKRLRHLDLCFSEMDDTFIENIDLILPNLISINLSSAKELSDCALNSFIKLKYLKRLKLSKNRFKRGTFPQITDSGIEKLMTSTPSLRWLIFCGQPNITQKAIVLFIELAQKYPKESYRFECRYKYFEENGDNYLNILDTSSLTKPNNLFLSIERIDDSEEEVISTDESETDEMSESMLYDTPPHTITSSEDEY